MVAVWDWPDESVHATLTESPGWYGTIRWVSCVAEVTAVPSTLVTVEPVSMPASSAPEPGLRTSCT